MNIFTRIVFFTLSFLCTTALLAQPVNDFCSGAIELPPFGRLQSCPLDNGVTLTTGLTGSTNQDATVVIPFPEFGRCGNGPSPNAYYTFTASGPINEITITSGDMAGLQIVTYVAPDCNNLQTYNCEVGTSSVNTTVFARPGDRIFFFVAGEPNNNADFGTYDIVVNSSSDCDACAREDNGQITINPRNETGSYSCGSTVEICFTLFEFDGDNSGTEEWIHSIIPAFGTGWDVTSISPTRFPRSCNGDGDWRWYPNGWTGCGTGEVYERGFAYESDFGFMATCGLNTPGNNYGDGGPGCTAIPAPITWCWNISVLDCPPGSGTFTGDDLTVGVRVLSDGFSGSWRNQACPETSFEIIAGVIVCDDDDPLVTGTDETCPGVADGSITVNPNGGLDPTGSYNFSIRDGSSTQVASCISCIGTRTFTDLPPGTYTVETTGVLSGCPRVGTFTIGPGVAPTGAADHAAVCPDGGPIQLLGSTTESGTTITYSWSGPGGFTATGQTPFTADPAVEGTYRLIITVDGCPSVPIPVNVEYLAFDPRVAAASGEVCFGENIELEVTGEGDNYAWRDPDGLPVGGNSPTLTTPALVAGTRTYSVVVSDANCSTTLSVDVEVRPEITGRIIMNPNGQVCEQSEIDFSVVMADGTRFPGGWTYDWDNGASFNPTYSYTPFFSGNEVVELNLTSPDGSCSQTFLEPYIIHPLPDVSLSTTDGTICEDGSIDITATATGGQAPYTYLWGPDVAVTTSTLTVDVNSLAQEDFFVEVTDNQGCVGLSPLADVFVILGLPAVTFSGCDVISPNEIRFTWSDVGQEYFEVYATIDGGTERVVSLNFTEFEHTLTDLGEGTEITLRVIPVSERNGVGCPGEAASSTCFTPSCDPVTPVITTPVDTFCLDGTASPVALTVDVPTAGTVVWSGTGVSGAQFDPVAAGAGEHVITATYTEGFCDYVATIELVVVSRPVAFFTVSDPVICQGDTCRFAYTGDMDPGYTYEWTLPNGATVEAGDPNTSGPLTVRFNDAPGIYDVSLDVASPHCLTSRATNTISVDAPPDPVIVNCADVSFDRVGFSWSHPTATDFNVTVLDEPAGATITQDDNSLLATGLAEGESVTIFVEAVVPGPCGNASGGPITCTARSCPDVTLVVPSFNSLCPDDDQEITLTGTVNGSDATASLTWTWPDGSTVDRFRPDTLTPGIYPVRALYTEDDCDFTAFANVTILSPPNFVFNLPAGPICTNETVGADAGAELGGTFYDWEITDPDGTVAPGTDEASRILSWSTPGQKFVTVTVTDIFGCPGISRTESIEVVAPLQTPVVSCNGSTLTSVDFVWADQAAADSFRVEIAGQPAFFQDSARLTVNGLSQGDVIDLTVTALGSGPCGNSPASTATGCEAGSCPTITVTVPVDESFCSGATAVITELTATQSGGESGGTFSFSGPGISLDNGVYRFDPDAAGPGDHVITAVYDDGSCSGAATFLYTVNAPPTADFTLNGEETNPIICAGENFTVAYAGDVPESEIAVFSWDFAGATGGPVAGYETYEYAFPDPGTYVISLDVLANFCPAAPRELTVTVEAPLPAPEVNCSPNGRNAITFSWEAVPGATGYLTSDGNTLAANELSYTVAGLAPGTSVDLSVTALSPGVCGNSSASAASSCTTLSCPDFALNLNGLAREVCLLNGDETIDLSVITVDGGNGGDFLFGGPGVSGTTFDAVAAGGQESGIVHVITVEYTENGPCTFSGDFGLTVFARPSAFITEAAPTCQEEAIRILIGSTNFVSDQDITVDWDGGIIQDDGNPGDNSYLIRWETPGTKTVTASVVSNISGCASLPTTQEFQLLAPPVVRADNEDQTICLDGAEGPVALSASLDDGSAATTAIWSGTGVEDPDGDNPVFNPANLMAGTYVIYVDYDGPTSCDSRDSVTFTLSSPPFAEIGPRPAQACAGEPVSILLNGNAVAGVDYQWDFADGTATPEGNETYSVSWDTPGTKTITLTAADGCRASDQVTIEITPTLSSPVPVCSRQDLDGVLYTWPAVAAATEGYQVSINGGTFGPLQTETEFLVSDLSFGEVATMSVRAVRSGTTCDMSVASAPLSCAARECPNVTLAPAAAQTEFCAGTAGPVTLRANLSGQTGNAVPVWTGPGVVLNPADSTYTFDPALAGIGNHTLLVSYVEEAVCGYEGSLDMTVFAPPSADFSVAENQLCTNSGTTVSLVEDLDPRAIYTWDFSTAAVFESDTESYAVDWNVAGDFTITLAVTKNGCTATSSQTVSVTEPPSVVASDQPPLEVCAGVTESIDLSDRLAVASEGGNWRVVSGSGITSGSLDDATGLLDPSGLGAGEYLFAYTASGGNCPDATAEVALTLLDAPLAEAGPDQLLTCNMGMVSLDGTRSEAGEGYTYRWFSEDPGVMITDVDQTMIDVGQPGTYLLEVTSAIGCFATDAVTVTAETEAPVMEVSLSQISCFQADDGAILVTNVNGGRAPYTFRLNGEDRGSSTLFPGLQPQAYDVQVTDANGCFSNIVLDLTEPEELTVSLRFPGDSNTVNAGEEIFITASINGGNPLDTLIWELDSLKNTNGQIGIEITARETQLISVTVVDELGCTATDREMLLVRKNRPVYFPTAFSPNGDNINDIWFIGGDLSQVVSIQDFIIFDRWGEVVHDAAANLDLGSSTRGGGLRPNDPSIGWDGTLNGETMNPQVFIYSVRVNFSDGESIVYKGDFMLMR